MPRARVVRSFLIASGAMSLGVFSPVMAAPQQAQPDALAEVSAEVWRRAVAGAGESALSPLAELEATSPRAEEAALAQSYAAVGSAIAKREQLRGEKLAEVRAELEKRLAEDATGRTLSDALKDAVTIYELSADKSSVLGEPTIAALIERAGAAAREAERDGNWLLANELFYRLNALLDRDGAYRDDVDRVATRLTMIRMYVPERFWQLRNEQRLADDKPELPPFNPLGEDYHAKLKGVDQTMVIRSLHQAAIRHVEHVSMNDIMLGGIEGLRTLATTEDLQPAFPGLADAAQRDRFVAFLDTEARTLGDPADQASAADLRQLVTDVLAANASTVDVSVEALLHEFGSGAMRALDEFSSIIWPDELKRFERITQGQFQGVGIHIQFDEERQAIKVLAPLEGTPAQRAGVQAGDLIKGIDGQSAIGISLTQAVELITGPANTKVTLTMEREGEDLDFTLMRAIIPLPSVKGWRRTGAGDMDWDWFIDPGSGIGYVRLTGFQESTTTELRQAIADMRAGGALHGLILDLRFNPGGLLTQAVSVANLFVDQGVIVSTEGTMPSQSEEAKPGRALLKDVPVVVLINQGSASASEIVSGAIRHYADAGSLRAVLVGERTYGKGSVQNVWPLNQSSALKLTTQYYKLPSGKIIHRKPGETDWGVDPHVRVEMLPEQVSKALEVRMDADLLATEAGKAPPDPDILLTEGIDLQLQTAVVMLQAKTAAAATAQARIGG